MRFCCRVVRGCGVTSLHDEQNFGHIGALCSFPEGAGVEDGRSQSGGDLGWENARALQAIQEAEPGNPDDFILEARLAELPAERQRDSGFRVTGRTGELAGVRANAAGSTGENIGTR